MLHTFLDENRDELVKRCRAGYVFTIEMPRATPG